MELASDDGLASYVSSNLTLRVIVNDILQSVKALSVM